MPRDGDAVAAADAHTIDALPDELLVCVLAFLPAQQLIRARRVSLVWKTLIDAELALVLRDPDDNALVSRVPHSSALFRILQVSDGRRLSSDALCTFAARAPHLTEVFVSSTPAMNDRVIADMLRQCEQLASLSLHDCPHAFVERIPYTRLVEQRVRVEPDVYLPDSEDEDPFEAVRRNAAAARKKRFDGPIVVNADAALNELPVVEEYERVDGQCDTSDDDDSDDDSDSLAAAAMTAGIGYDDGDMSVVASGIDTPLQDAENDCIRLGVPAAAAASSSASAVASAAAAGMSSRAKRSAVGAPVGVVDVSASRGLQFVFQSYASMPGAVAPPPDQAPRQRRRRGQAQQSGFATHIVPEAYRRVRRHVTVAAQQVRELTLGGAVGTTLLDGGQAGVRIGLLFPALRVLRVRGVAELDAITLPPNVGRRAPPVLPALEELDVHGCDDVEIVRVSSSALRRVRLAQCTMLNAFGVHRDTRLRSLDVEGALVSGALATSYGGVQCLEQLRLHGAAQSVCDALLARVSALDDTALRDVSVDGVVLRASQLAAATRMRSLSVGGGALVAGSARASQPTSFVWSGAPIESLTLHDFEALTRVECASTERLRSLVLRNCPRVTHEGVVAIFSGRARALEHLEFVRCDRVTEQSLYEVLRAASSVRTLAVRDSAWVYALLVANATLQRIELSGNAGLQSVELRTPALQTLVLSDLGKLATCDLHDCAALQEVRIVNCAVLQSISARGRCGARTLSIRDSAALDRVALEDAPTLEHLELSRVRMSHDTLVRTIAALPALRSLVLSSLGGDAESITIAHPQLVSLSIRHAARVARVRLECPQLADLALAYSARMSDDALRECLAGVSATLCTLQLASLPRLTGSALASLDICAVLQQVGVQMCGGTAYRVSAGPSLRTVSVRRCTQLTSLDVSSAVALRRLFVVGCVLLRSIAVADQVSARVTGCPRVAAPTQRS